MCIGNLSLPEKIFELLMFSSEFLKFWYFPSDIAQTVFGRWFTRVNLKTYTGYNYLLYNERFQMNVSSVSFSL